MSPDVYPAINPITFDAPNSTNESKPLPGVIMPNYSHREQMIGLNGPINVASYLMFTVAQYVDGIPGAEPYAERIKAAAYILAEVRQEIHNETLAQDVTPRVTSRHVQPSLN